MSLHGYFETEIFRWELEDAEVDRVTLGEDCARWFKSGLRAPAVAGEPVQEDWGWALPTTLEGQQLWLMLQKWHSTERGWHVWIEPKGAFSWLWRQRSRAAAVRLRDLVERLLMDETRVSGLRWVESVEALD
jgi:hypothetical protein